MWLTHSQAEHDLWYQYSSYMTVYQRLNYPHAFECWFSGSCDDLRAMIAFSWLSWMTITLLLALAVAGPASNGAFVPFMVAMRGAGRAGQQTMVVFDEEAFEYRTANLGVQRSSSSSEYVSASENRPAAASFSEKARLVEGMD